MSPFLHFVSSSSYWFKFTYHILISPVNERTPGQISISYTHRNLYSEQVRSKVLACVTRANTFLDISQLTDVLTSQSQSYLLANITNQ